jgi:hypothetical protein
MNLLLLAPELQEEILFLELPQGTRPVSERRFREAVLRTIDWQEQRRRWEAESYPMRNRAGGMRRRW